MLTRRDCLAAGSAALLAPAALAAADEKSTQTFDPGRPLPHKNAFAPFATTYLNSASQHPLSLGARNAVSRYLDYKSFSTDSEYSVRANYDSVLEKYATLINAHDDEVCFVQSTTVGENLVLKALDFPGRKGRIVTDELHYVGSLPTYAELARRGVEIVTLRAGDDGRILLDQFADAIDGNTRLVTVSLVSMVNGFQHDLKSICDVAHARGAMVYADAVQAVGAVPLDVRESGVDFCSAASYKWLMGDQGLGFLFARKDRLSQIERPWFGHYQLGRSRALGFPNPDRGADFADAVTDYAHFDSARGYFAMGSQSNIVASMLEHSLDYLLRTGVRRIQDYRQPLLGRLRDALPALGFAPITPPESKSSIISFRHDGSSDALRARLQEAKVTATIGPFHLRISPSVFNDADDIERLLRALT